MFDDLLHHEGHSHVGAEGTCKKGGITWWRTENPPMHEYDAMCRKCWPKREDFDALLSKWAPQVARFNHWTFCLNSEVGWRKLDASRHHDPPGLEFVACRGTQE